MLLLLLYRIRAVGVKENRQIMSLTAVFNTTVLGLGRWVVNLSGRLKSLFFAEKSENVAAENQFFLVRCKFQQADFV